MKALKLLWIVAAVLVIVLATAAPLFAQPPAGTSTSYAFAGASVGAGVGAGVVILGAGYGFGRIGGAALESMARQPEVAGRVGTSMIVIAALLEGATFFALVVCLLVSLKGTF
jgi:F-type H+-transporting ATPase subunit c